MIVGITKEFEFKGKVWVYPGPAAWYFVNLPRDISEEIKFLFSDKKRGFGSLKVKAMLRKTSWKTSIFPDSKSGSYVLPLKADIRKKENIKENDIVEFSIVVVS